MASATFNNYKVLAMQGGVNLTTDTIKVALMTASYTPNTNTQVYWSDVSANEASGTGYVAGGATLSTPTITNDTANSRSIFNAANVTWPTSTISARYAVIYKSTGVASTSPLIAVIDFLATKSSVGDTFPINWSTSPAGIFSLT